MVALWKAVSTFLPHIGLDFEAEHDTLMHQKGMKRFIMLWVILGRAGQASKLIHLTWVKGGASGIGFIVVRGWGQGEGFCVWAGRCMVWISLPIPREGPARLLHGLALIWSKREKGSNRAWNLSAVRHQKLWLGILLLVTPDVWLINKMCHVSFNWIWTSVSHYGCLSMSPAA